MVQTWQVVPLGHPHCSPNDTYDGLKCRCGPPDHCQIPLSPVTMSIRVSITPYASVTTGKWPKWPLYPSLSHLWSTNQHAWSLQMLARTVRSCWHLICTIVTTAVGATLQNMGVTSRKCPVMAGFPGLLYAIIGRPVRVIAQNVCADRPVILTSRLSRYGNSRRQSY